MKWLLPLRANGAPALLDNHWLIYVIGPKSSVTHEVEVRLDRAVPPAVTADFVSIVWRRLKPNGAGHAASLHNARLPIGLGGGPDGPVAQSWLEHVTVEDERLAFMLTIVPVWAPHASS